MKIMSWARQGPTLLALISLTSCGQSDGSSAAPYAPNTIASAADAGVEAKDQAPERSFQLRAESNVAEPNQVNPSTGGGIGVAGCAAEIGQQSAEALAARCRSVSPATHPPCNVVNSCAVIRSEIARGCGLLADGQRPDFCARKSPDEAAAGATEVVKAYYSALQARDYHRAYRLWDRDGAASGKSFAQFKAGFGDTASTRVEAGRAARPEGAAGSIYVTVPVTIVATGTDGSQRSFTGSYVMRRIGAISGASEAQRTWHIASASLRP